MQNSKPLPASEREVTTTLARALPRLLDGLTIERVEMGEPVGRGRVDLVADVRIGPVKKTLLIEVKRVGEPQYAQAGIYQVLGQARTARNAYPVLAAPYLTASVRKMCKEAGVGYIDLVGNVYLQFANVLIDRVVPETPQRERRSLRSLASPKTSRVIRTLLSEPGRVLRLSELARASSVSPAEAFKVASLLEMKGFLQRDPTRRLAVTKPGELLDAWAASLSFKKNWIVSTYSLEQSPESIMRAVASAAERGNAKYAFTMFSGASLLAPFVRFYDVTSYVGGEIEWWIERLDLKEVDSGSNLQLVVPRDMSVFEDAQEVNGLRVVSSPQLYADLYGNPGRGREAAAELRERVLRF